MTCLIRCVYHDMFSTGFKLEEETSVYAWLPYQSKSYQHLHLLAESSTHRPRPKPSGAAEGHIRMVLIDTGSAIQYLDEKTEALIRLPEDMLGKHCWLT